VSDDPNAALARAAAEIAELKGALAAARDQHDVIAAQLAGAGAERDAALQESAGLNRQLAALRDEHAALQAQWNAAHAELEPGISRSASYQTDDGQTHPTLRQARLHLIGRLVGISPAQSAQLVAQADRAVPMIQRAQSD
jgi:chromosome segregation ATPase